MIEVRGVLWAIRVGWAKGVGIESELGSGDPVHGEVGTREDDGSAESKGGRCQFAYSPRSDRPRGSIVPKLAVSK